MENKKLRICHIGPGLDTPGGMTKVIERIIKSEYLNNIDFFWIVSVSKTNKIWTFFRAILKLIFTHRKYDILHIHMSENGSCYRSIIWVNLGKLVNLKVIVHSHGGEFEKFYNNLKYKVVKFLFKNAMNKAEKIIVLTPGWADFWKGIVSETKISIIPNFIQIYDIVNKKYLEGGSLNLLFVGYIGERKGTYDLIKAINLLVNSGVTNLFLTIVGNGEIDQASALVNEFNLGNYINVMGWTDEKKLQEMFLRSDLLILPSYYESFGLVIIEAMSNKVPVIVGDKGYSKELLGPNTGVTIESGNVAQLASEINKFFDHTKLKEFGNNGYLHVQKHFSEPVVTARLLNLYRCTSDDR